MKFGRNDLHVNTHHLMESHVSFETKISKRRPWKVVFCHIVSESSVAGTPVRTANMCAFITVYKCGIQYSTEQF